MTKPSSIHFVGIKGVGMTPLAIIAKEAGIAVTGSDIDEKFITDLPLEKAGITPLSGFSPDHVGDAALVITTGAHSGYDNPEVKFAKTHSIPVLTQGEAVGLFMEGSLIGTKYKGIAVAGSHGKTTTSAMLATILNDAGKDPGYLIGTSDIPSLSGMPGHFGTGPFFVAEVDEYATEPKYDKTPKLWHVRPEIAIITNIEHDHPDIYATLQDTLDAFKQFLRNISDNGLLVVCGDAETARQLRDGYSGNVRTYGYSPLNDYVLTGFTTDRGYSSFTVQGKDIDLGTFTLQVPGKHNALNAVAATLVALELGIPLAESKKSLHAFVGTKRRLERKGTLRTGAVIYDDYAHHPTEIKSSLQALKHMYRDKEIVCVFQPHTYSRTRELFSEFSQAFSDADRVILLPIFASSREATDTSVSSEMLTEEIKKRQRNVFFLKTQDDVVEYIGQNRFGDDAVIVTMGAGDVYKITDRLQHVRSGE